MYRALIRFYQELNEFLTEEQRFRTLECELIGNPGVKDLIESFGVPHTEVDLVLANSEPVDFAYQVQDGDRISVYPVFESLDIQGVSRVRSRPLRRPAFVLDVHLGRLAALLRLLGFDTLYRRDYDDPEIVRIALEEGRIILTRDQGILKRKAVTHGYFVRSRDPEEQAREVIRRFDLSERVAPFSRCLVCNNLLESVDADEVAGELPPGVRGLHREVTRCAGCGRYYWPGTHYESLREAVSRIMGPRGNY
ncbi:MAG: Mut7-C RNAse domain-containing protein [Spirochaetota bacterium]